MTHGGTSKRSVALLRKAYRSWNKMRQRCSDPNNNRFAVYGARGIKVCKRWQKFECFLLDMGFPPSESHSIERKDNDGNYSKSNCKWATRYEQANNRRNNRALLINGERKTLAQWGRISGLGMKVLWSRLKKGWPVDEHLLQPLNSRRNSFTKLVEHNGMKKSITQWAKEYDLPYGVLFGRIRIGTSRDKLFLPVGAL